MAIHWARDHFRKQGGVRHLIELAAKQRPQILVDWDRTWQNTQENACREIMIHAHDYYQTIASKDVIFNQRLLYSKGFQHYLAQHRLQSIAGERTAQWAVRLCRSAGGISRLVQLAAEERPQILRDWRTEEDEKAMIVKKHIKSILLCHSYWLSLPKKTRPLLSTTFVQKHDGLLDYFHSMGMSPHAVRNAYCWGTDHGGFKHLLQLAATSRPSILRDWYNPEQINLGRILDAHQVYRRHVQRLPRNNRPAFDTTFIVYNKVMIEHYRKCYDNAGIGCNLCLWAKRNYRSAGGIDHLIELAARKRPGIIKDWISDGKKERRGKR
jgi:hypothetical protein